MLLVWIFNYVLFLYRADPCQTKYHLLASPAKKQVTLLCPQAIMAEKLNLYAQRPGFNL